MTNLQKCIEYCSNLCYSICERRINERDFKEVFFMMDATMMKNFYNECSDLYNEKEKKQEIRKSSTLLTNMYYNFKLKSLAKKIDLKSNFEKNKDICGGKVVIKGTRITPKTIACNVLRSIHTDSNKLDNKCLENAINKTKKDYPALSKETIILCVLYCVIYHFK